MAIVFPATDSELGHIFRKESGHVEDTAENRELLLSVANDESARLESDQYGNAWAARLLPDGRQAWVRVRNEKIINGGINAGPRIFNAQTGLNRR